MVFSMTPSNFSAFATLSLSSSLRDQKYTDKAVLKTENYYLDQADVSILTNQLESELRNKVDGL